MQTNAQLSKNLYENKLFIEKYYNAQKVDKFHKFEEKPAIHRLLKDLRGKAVLCVGCGNGDECAYIKRRGAKRVIGIDISKSMIELAKEKHKNIEFHVMSANKLYFKDKEFDIVYSDLVLHYIKNIEEPVKEVFRVLKPGGKFIFSVMHPLYTAFERKEKRNKKEVLFGYIKIKNRYKIIGDYFSNRIRKTKWFNYVLREYRRTFSDLITPLINAGFIIEKVVEPRPLRKLKAIDPQLYKKLSKIPEAIIIVCRKDSYK